MSVGFEHSLPPMLRQSRASKNSGNHGQSNGDKCSYTRLVGSGVTIRHKNEMRVLAQHMRIGRAGILATESVIDEVVDRVYLLGIIYLITHEDRTTTFVRSIG